MNDENQSMSVYDKKSKKYKSQFLITKFCDIPKTILTADQIKNKIFKCNKCELSKLEINNFSSSSVLFDNTNFEKHKIMVVAQNPSRIRNNTSVLSSNSKTDNMFIKAIELFGFFRNDFYCTNLIKCSTFDNTLPSRECTNICYSHLLNEIQYVEPILILVLGSAARTIFNGVKRGFSHFNVAGTKYTVFSVDHPSYIVRENSTFMDYAKDIYPICNNIIKESHNDT